FPPVSKTSSDGAYSLSTFARAAALSSSKFRKFRSFLLGFRIIPKLPPGLPNGLKSSFAFPSNQLIFLRICWKKFHQRSPVIIIPVLICVLRCLTMLHQNHENAAILVQHAFLYDSTEKDRLGVKDVRFLVF
ncbi:hypothetical protein C5167_019404, partial [Papaver somniferum]